jgi:hypothetical protein
VVSVAFVFSASPLCIPGALGQQVSDRAQEHTKSGASDSTAADALPDSPGTVLTAARNDALPEQSASPAAQSGQQSAPPPPEPSQAPANPQKPVGTAAAETPNASGIAASQPAGVAIAPAKQRRARTIVLRVGALVAAGVAVGSVVALTRATASKPPGAH